MNKTTFLLVGILLTIFFSGGAYLYQYRACLVRDLSLCLSSKKFLSKKVNLSFRYPNYFPLSQPKEDWEVKYADERFVEFVEFSPNYYTNAGGERLGSVRVHKKEKIQNINDFEKELLKPQKIYSSHQGKDITLPPPKIQHIRIGNNIEALKIIYSDQLSTFESVNSEYVFYKEGLRYQIDFFYNDYYHKLPKEKYDDGFNLIVSSLSV